MSSGLPTGCPGVDGALSVNPISRNAISLHLVAGMLRSRDQRGLETTFLVSVSVSQ